MTNSSTSPKWLRRGCQLATIPLIMVACDATPEYRGKIIETRGGCHTIMGDPDAAGKRVRYAVHAGDLGTLTAGTRIIIRGTVSTKQDCAAAVVLVVKSVEAE